MHVLLHDSCITIECSRTVFGTVYQRVCHCAQHMYSALKCAASYLWSNQTSVKASLVNQTPFLSIGDYKRPLRKAGAYNLQSISALGLVHETLNSNYQVCAVATIIVTTPMS